MISRKQLKLYRSCGHEGVPGALQLPRHLDGRRAYGPLCRLVTPRPVEVRRSRSLRSRHRLPVVILNLELKTYPHVKARSSSRVFIHDAMA